MSGQVTGWVIRHPERPDDPALWRLLVVMADAADTAGRNIRLTGKTVAQRAVMSHWYARELIRRAVAEGWLEVTVPGGSHRPAVYRFVNYDPEVSAPRSALTADAKRGWRAQICAPQERALSAPALREFTPNGFTVITGGAAGPATAQEGRAGAENEGPPEPAGEVARAEAIRQAKRALAAACDRCDEDGWLDHGGNAGRWCDHQRPPRGEPSRIPVDETAMPLPEPGPPPASAPAPARRPSRAAGDNGQVPAGEKPKRRKAKPRQGPTMSDPGASDAPARPSWGPG